MIKKILICILALYSSTCIAEPKLQETLKFMTTILSHGIEDDQYTATLENNGCNITYTNHPKYNNIDKDNDLVIYTNYSSFMGNTSNPTIDSNGTCTVYHDSIIAVSEPSILDEAQVQTERAMDAVAGTLLPIKKGFLDYFSNNDKKNNTNDGFSPEEHFYTANENYGIFLSKFNLSMLNPKTIKEYKNGFSVETTNGETIEIFSSYTVICDDLKKVESIFDESKGKTKIIKIDKEPKIKSVFFNVNHKKQKFKKALQHAIKLCGGKDDLF